MEPAQSKGRRLLVKGQVCEDKILYYPTNEEL